jgi:hypothetical protein
MLAICKRGLKKPPAIYYFFFTNKTLAIHGDLDSKDFLLCSHHFCKRETRRDSKRGVQAKRERGGNE